MVYMHTINVQKTQLNMRYKYLLLGVIASWCFSACATILNTERASFRLDSIPKGAKVTTHTGAILGFTPIVLKLPKKAQNSSEKVIYVSISGYKTAKVKITPEFNKKTLFNFFFLFSLGLPSSTVDMANGMVYRYQPGRYVVEMRKVKPVSMGEISGYKDSEKSIKRTENKANTPLKMKAEAAQKERQEAEQKAKLEAEQKAKLEADQKARFEAESKLADERKRLADEKDKLAAERAEIERLKIEAERIKLEKERKKLEQEKKALQKSLQEETEVEDSSSEPDPEPDLEPNQAESPEDTLRTKEEKLLESMKRRYQNELKRRQKNRPKRDPRVPGIEVEPLSLRFQSPSYGALALSIAQHQVLLRDFALGEGRSSQELFLRLCLALDQDFEPQKLMKLYPRFMEEARQSSTVLSSLHGLALFRAIKPIHESLIALN
ncbi:MAG: hypothetical protein CMH49_04030 [Myxococcales bacterium]|nr:hypothetical protein [Myxococcales bacterium]